MLDLKSALAFAAPHSERRWAIEGAAGMGALLARQLVAAGETVLDVPPTRYELITAPVPPARQESP